MPETNCFLISLLSFVFWKMGTNFLGKIGGLGWSGTDVPSDASVLLAECIN